ncbi:MAG: hypothetical protein PHQ52_01660 [Candidatus Omnitrophica bacterium]|nr:hypothetical protein [Candidatus Omnitrophota bacterium]
MQRLLKNQVEKMKKPLNDLYLKVKNANLSESNISSFSKMISDEMRKLEYDSIKIDGLGNIVGMIKGHSNKSPLVLIANIDYQDLANSNNMELKKNNMIAFKAGLLTSIYVGSLLKSSLLPLDGNLYVCCIPRLNSGDYGIRYLFENSLKEKLSKIKGIILCEPTARNINVGHKGRLEYEIVVKGTLGTTLLENKGINMLGAMFPLINELERFSKGLPQNALVGDSNLSIKNVGINRSRQPLNYKEFKVVVERGFVPEENSVNILKKAKSIAKDVYKGQPDLQVSTALVKEKIRTYTGMSIVSKKEFRPWKIESHHNFVVTAMDALKENRSNVSIDYWKKIVTEGAYLFSELGIPTIGFGAGSEDDIEMLKETISVNELLKTVYEQAFIVHRSIGIPTFGWSSDEI